MTAAAPSAGPDSRDLHHPFLVLLPHIERHARLCFRQVPCPGSRDDRVAEAVGLAWKWYLRLLERGKDVRAFPAVFCSLVVRAVRSGRRLCGQERATDALSSVARRRHAFTVRGLPPAGDVFDEALRDNTRSPVPDQAAFRSDFRDWLRSLTRRERAVVRRLARGHTTGEVARSFGVSAARISQLRRRFRDGWRALGEPVRRGPSRPS